MIFLKLDVRNKLLTVPVISMSPSSVKYVCLPFLLCDLFFCSLRHSAPSGTCCWTSFVSMVCVVSSWCPITEISKK